MKNNIYICNPKTGDSLAQQVEHNTFNVGVLGSSPRRITKKPCRNAGLFCFTPQCATIPAQAETFFLSAPEKIPHSRAESYLCASRAGWAADSRAGGYIFLFRAENDTSFPRRTVLRRIPSGKGSPLPRRRLHFSFPRRK